MILIGFFSIFVPDFLSRLPATAITGSLDPTWTSLSSPGTRVNSGREKSILY